MIFIDANVPMYLVGATHRHKHDAYSTLERLALERRRLVTSSEVFQEMLHRYVSINRRDAMSPLSRPLRVWWTMCSRSSEGMHLWPRT